MFVAYPFEGTGILLLGGYIMPQNERIYYGISKAAELCGVNAKQLLYWEEKGYLPTPQRIEFGKVSNRQYSDEDLRLVCLIKKFREKGFTLPESARRAALLLLDRRGGGKDGQE